VNGAAPMTCLVCGAPSGAPVYRYDGSTSVSSTARPIDVPTVVFACEACAHVQTPPLRDIERYYDQAYNVRLESDEADDLYALRDGTPVYRTQHQADVALAKLDLPRGASVLDYGCGKGMSLQAMLRARPDLDAAVFDVSDAYRSAWDAFVPRENQAAYATPPSWQGRFDAVLSFFALEHVGDPRGFLAGLRGLLRPGGEAHITVPNVRRNAGDFIVVDHVNHFMPTSLRTLFANAGFAGVRIDEEAHAAAYVVNATAHHPEPVEARAAYVPAASDVAEYLAESRALATFWSNATGAVRAFERDVASGRKAAIYGSGFYGVFIASRLADRSNVAYFLDRNPHQQAKRIFDRAVVPPEAVADDVEVIYAGLNPANARDIIAGVPALHRRARDVFFL
jgi:2-polyprenyl-3-methyl-5-hydroxy-6-metoxy-1,4-benzoquinol methylase